MDKRGCFNQTVLVVCFATVANTMAEDLVTYYKAKGHRQRGDEETRDYSDDEGPPESTATRRDRREFVRQAHATVRHVEARARDTVPAVRASQSVGASNVNAEGNILVRFLGLLRPDETTFRGVRGVEPALHTQLQATRFSHTTSAWSTPTEAEGHAISFNLVQLAKRHIDAKRWKFDFCIFLIFALAGLALIWYVKKTLGPYL
jgi:hypothetical protein